MGVMPINKLLITMSLPMIVSMMVQALYNVVDSIFVAQISENALTAVSLAFPVQNLMIAVATGTGVGVNSLVAKNLGAKKPEEANRIATNGVILAFVSYLVFLLIGLTCSKVFFTAQTDVKEIVDNGFWYMLICCVASFGVFGQIIFERLLQATGKTVLSMCTQGLGAVVNLVLDPILIFGWLGLPAMGVAGAALATVIGQIAAFFFGMFLNRRCNKEIHVSLRKYKPDAKSIKQIYGIGYPSIIMQSIGSVMTFGFNKILIAFTETAATVFGVYFKLQSFIFMPVFGVNNGLVPVFSFNYGAQNRKRMMQALKVATLYAMGFMVFGIFMFQVFPTQLLGMFNASEEMLKIGVPAMRIICLSYVFAGFCITVGSAFQALGKGLYSMLVSVARQLIVLLPAAYLLSLTGNVNMVWWSYPIAELASLGMTVWYLVKIYKAVISKIPLESK
ncbi:MAG: MATE family efflux transporter [Clostridia bacterium]|nr:MATE family efflux transporter [Clostridia bacterium]